jgi:hypothetical protein
MALRRVFVAGGASTPFIGRGSPDFIGAKHPQYGKLSNPTIEQQLQQAVHSAFEQSRVLPDRLHRFQRVPPTMRRHPPLQCATRLRRQLYRRAVL